MITIKAPEVYLNQTKLLDKSGELIAPIGKKALIIGGKTALEVVGEGFFKSLAKADILYQKVEYVGYPTNEAIADLSQKAQEIEADILIGVGGGRILDLTKAVADYLDIPVVTVPTIAATCAAWSALTITYDNQGTCSGYIILKESPRLVLADTQLLSEAPPRYIGAGISDTLVKWYETAPNVGNGPEYITERIGLQTAKLALDILEEHGYNAYKTAGKGQITNSLIEVIDAIIVLAGLVGSINGGHHAAAIAHGVHNSLTKFHETHEQLHGEKVGFGLIVQLFLEGKNKEEIKKTARFLHSLGQPVTLSDLGIQGDIKKKAQEIAQGFVITPEAAAKLPFKINHELLSKAILDTDALGLSIIEIVS